MPRMRAFLALPLSPSLEQTLTGAVEGLRAQAPDSRFVAAANLHVSVRALGTVDEAALPQMELALRAALQLVDCFTLRVEGAGTFGKPSRPRSLFLALGGEVASLLALAQRVSEALVPVGFPAETRPLEPHLTLARARPGAGDHGLALLRRSLKLGSWGALPVTELVLFQSEPTPGGPRHTARIRIPLR